MDLRDYQQAAVDSVWAHLRTREDNPCVVVPTGGGKTPVIARLCSQAVRDWSGRVLILAHVRELLSQSLAHLTSADPTLTVGVYSAGLKSRDVGYPVTVAGIQSAYRNVEDFGKVDLVIIDEAHRIPPDGEGMYRTLIEALKGANPSLRLIGMTATPYRMTSGPICARENLLHKVCFEVKIPELIAKGFLCPVSAAGPTQEEDFSRVSIRAGEFKADELESLMNDDAKVLVAVGEMYERAAKRKSILVFASGVAHGKKIAGLLRDAGELVGEVYGETDADERDVTIKAFRDGSTRWLVNVDVLTLGFDAPNVDCVVLLRATMSPGLYYQMVGRGFRIHASKTDALVLDFGGNVLRHGMIDTLDPDAKKKDGTGGEAPVKKCPKCLRYVAIACMTCPTCGHQWLPKQAARHGEESYVGAVVSSDEPETLDVYEVEYSLHEKAREDGSTSRSLRVSYYYEGMHHFPVSEWVCLEHTGYAREKAVAWWSKRSAVPPPESVEDALTIIHECQFRRPSQIRVKREGKYLRVIGCKFSESVIG